MSTLSTALKCETGAHPFVSVIMPVRNEERFIERSLRNVLAQDYPPASLEVIVVDGMSSDNTRHLVHDFQAQDSRIRLLDNPGKIVPIGLNLAIAQAQGEIVVRVDGHCEIASDYVRRCVDHLLNNDVDAVGGPLETIGETPTADVIARAMSSSFGVGDSAFRTKRGVSMLTDTVAFPAYKRRLIERVGPFDEELVRNQDDEYNCRLRKTGAKILLASDVQCRYYSRSSFRSLWRQYFQYGYWKIRVIQKNPRQVRIRHFVPAIFVTALMSSISMIPFVEASRFILAVVVASYVVAIVGASLWQVRRRYQHYLLLLPVAYATLHLSYGFGFLTGLVRFWNRWWDNKSRLGHFSQEVH